MKNIIVDTSVHITPIEYQEKKNTKSWNKKVTSESIK